MNIYIYTHIYTVILLGYEWDMRYGISDSDFPNLHRDNGDQVVTLGVPNFRQAIYLVGDCITLGWSSKNRKLIKAHRVFPRQMIFKHSVLVSPVIEI